MSPKFTRHVEGCLRQWGPGDRDPNIALDHETPKPETVRVSNKRDVGGIEIGALHQVRMR
jgi:hypothetical protein